MEKRVVYNGGTESYYDCSSPSKLVAGKEYEVIASSEREWQTDYTLKGIEGKFNSAWFNEVQAQPRVTMAISNCMPQIGQKYNCYTVGFYRGNPKIAGIVTAPVKSVEYAGDNVYEVITASSNIYVVKVNA